MKHFQLPFLFFFLFYSVTGMAQIMFQRTYGFGLHNQGRSVHQTIDGGYIIGGTVSDIGAGETDIDLFKVDSLGNYQWNRTFGGSGVEQGYSVVQTSDSGYAICGYTNSFGYGGYDAYVIRTDKNGDTLWTRTYGTTDWDFVYSIKQTTDSGFVLAGNSYGDTAGISQSWVLKLSPNGDVQWSKLLTLPNENLLNAIMMTPDNEFVATGYMAGGVNNSQDILVIKLTSTGDLIWHYSFGGGGNDIGTSLDTTNDGNYIIGATYTNDTSGHTDFYLLKMDTSGTEKWHNEFHSTAGDLLLSIHQLHNGGYVTCGFTGGAGFGNDISLIITDNNGGYVSSRTYGGTQYDVGYDLNLCSDNGFVIVGKTNSWGPQIDNIYLVKTDSTGATNPNVVLSLNELNDNPQQIICYPIPAQRSVTIKIKDYNNLLFEQLQIMILNPAGQEVFSEKIGSKKLSSNGIIINTENFESGCYIVSVLSNKLNLKYKLLVSH